MSDAFRTRITKEYQEFHGWCTVDKACLMYDAILALDTCENIVELGVFAGRSLVALGLAMQTRQQQHLSSPHSSVVGIDAWSKAASLEGVNAASNDAWWEKIDYLFFKQYTQDKMIANGVAPIVRLIQSTSAAVADQFSNIDVLHQDSNHSTAVSTAEVHMWAPKIRPGGLWFFDDTDWATTQPAQALLTSTYGFFLVRDEPTWKIFRKEKQF